MMPSKPTTRTNRQGAIIVLAALLMASLAGLIAFATDYGYLLKVRTDLQRSADAAALRVRAGRAGRPYGENACRTNLITS